MSAEARSVLLAEKWTEQINPKGWWMSEKLDGVRAYWNGKNFYSRQGNLFVAPAWFKEDLPSTPLDGELWCGRGLFQKCIGIIKKQKDAREEDWQYVTYLVFDAPDQPGPYEKRVEFLNKVVRSDSSTSYAAVVGIRECVDVAHMKKYLSEVELAGGEGLMLREPKSKYENGRSSTLLKVKTFHDEEAKVIGHEEGEGRCQGMMGGLKCVLPNGKQFTVGTGFTDAQRQRPPKKGSVITFKFQELTNSGVPRFPVFLRIREDVTWEDVLESAKSKTPKSSIAKPIRELKKQHSILFSVIPSRDQETGEKRVTSDDEMEESEQRVEHKQMGAPIVINGEKVKPECKYGNQCFRTNKEHLDAFSHPADKPQPKVKKEEKKIPCNWGSKCHLQSKVHLAKYSHPKEEETAATGDEDATLEMVLKDKEEDEDEVISVNKKEWEALHVQLEEGKQRIRELEEMFEVQAPAAKKSKTSSDEPVEEEKDGRVPCIYGAKCTRKAEDHRQRTVTRSFYPKGVRTNMRTTLFALAALLVVASAFPRGPNGRLLIVGDDDHSFQAPADGAYRSPCPALNTLANHGYLPRSGQNITKDDLIQGLFKGLNVGRDIGFILANGAFKKFGATDSISLLDLQQHNMIEHDSSMTRNDNALGDSTVVNATLLQALLDSSSDDTVLTWKDMVAHRRRRQADSKQNNPSLTWNEEQKQAAAGEVAIFQLVFGDWNTGVDLAVAQSILGQEQFPDGWQPHEGTVLAVDVLPRQAIVRVADGF
ncbi:hypothetical protein PROFUN_02928 [Planoprotostelium fungivorum]|uniref:Uncharacterized protein n=1 Tax=Planoprotostelium fungivorum TaxID=1890364 RepID=A0A2P6NS38_9EUKA|nr:hypothetical protein PROFUN_02928 [Planoprotostelium fungivorum]